MSQNSFVFETSLFVPALLPYLICPSLDPPHGIKFLIIRMKEDMGPCCGWHKNQLQNVSSFSFFPLPQLQSKPAGGSCYGLLSGPPTSHAFPAYPVSQSVQSLSRVWLFATQWITARRPPCPSPTPGVYSNSCHRVGDAIQPSHPLSSPFPPAPNPS